MTIARFLSAAALLFSLTGLADRAPGATATQRVRMYFNLGSVDIDLYGNESPLHVANFLSYVNAQEFDGTYIHRTRCCDSSYFFVQGGEYYLPEPGDQYINEHFIIPHGTVPNEFDPNNGLSNTPGTLAAARTDDPDSAQNGWFINATNNAYPFDAGPYTVFGQVTRGMPVINYIPSLPNVPAAPGSFLETLPVYNGGFVFLYQVVERSLLDGDYDLNGKVDANDLAMWEADYNRMAITGPDFNGDKEIGSGDLANWEAGYGQFDGVTTFADFDNGDANYDGIVDGDDFLSWQRSVGLTTDVSADGDGNYEVNGDDFLFWQRNVGAPVPPPVLAPEPATAVLLLLGLFAETQALRGSLSC
jgi:peptidyl-prolyl cis-trans isomerase A (cyclophilin A)